METHPKKIIQDKKVVLDLGQFEKKRKIAISYKSPL